MTYHYEQLGDERFQKLVHSLLTTVFPDVQCLPVGQPDGGRDAFSRSRLSSVKVYQVKFSRSPSVKSEREALEELIKTESAKVERLKMRGLDSYYMISNISGTAHQDVGSIDRVNDILTAEFGIPSYCWWRDDLDARLSVHTDLKWSFPEIIKGSDLLEYLVKRDGTDATEKRRRAIQGYVASQYQEDREVKFKQADLQNRIIDLFVDLPILRLSKGRKQESRSYTVFLDSNVLERTNPSSAAAAARGRRTATGAANLLLTSQNSRDSQRAVIEGAPGQGKSTITQYICQVHRLRFLDKTSELASLPTTCRLAPLRLPFRIDLRDFASWIAGRNPFSTEASALPPGASLEQFVSAQVSSLSGGYAFSHDDLISTAKASPVCFVLDGFDEVADIDLRKRVVSEISKATQRLLSHDCRVQIIVTSRPAAFANSPGFPVEEWVHYELQDLTLEDSRLYTEKWLQAKQMGYREQQEFKKQVEEKLEQSHMRELARNPMQLTILLALIHVRGYSLPDKRTALYDSYMEIFFNRESEKSRVVRDHRDLLINIHRFLAWTLQTSAESAGSAGSIKEGDLRELLRRYLMDEGHDTGLIDTLFTGMVERVVALVSRVMGTYEFEVQPLREYFAARHLYETAPYSPPGKERKGTMPERFDSLARNFYWLNVARFYAGCYSRGELPSLVESLTELCHSPDFRLLGHPRVLAGMLLSDHVFAQHPTSVKKVVSNTLSLSGLVLMMTTDRDLLVLPESCGRNQLAETAYQYLDDKRVLDEHKSALMRIIRHNSDMPARRDWWLKRVPEQAQSFEQWLTTGRRLGVINHLPPEQEARIRNESLEEYLMHYVILARSEMIDKDEELLRLAVDLVLEKGPALAGRGLYGQRSAAFELFLASLAPDTYSMLLEPKYHEQPSHATSRILSSRDLPVINEIDFTNSATKAKLKRFLIAFTEQVDGPSKEWSTALNPWRAIVDTGFEVFGENWAIVVLATMGANVKSRQDRGTWTDAAWSATKGLVDRLRFARLNKTADWWATQLSGLETMKFTDKLTVLLNLFVYARFAIVAEVSLLVQETLRLLPESEWARLYRALEGILDIIGVKDRYGSSDTPEGVTEPRLCTLLARRFGRDYAVKLYDAGKLPADSNDPIIRALVAEVIVSKCVREPSSWKSSLADISNNIEPNSHLFELYGGGYELPLDIAVLICEEPAVYPSALVNTAHKQIAFETGSKVVKLAEAATNDGWFKI